MANDLKIIRKCNVCHEDKKLSEYSPSGNRYRLTCKKCRTQKACLSYMFLSEEAKKAKLEYVKEYSKTQNGKDSANKYNKSVKGKAKSKRQSNKDTENLSSYYIKDKLVKKGLTKEIITENPELIEVQRLIIKTKRLCKTLRS